MKRILLSLLFIFFTAWQLHAKNMTSNDQQLRLMYDAFVFEKDLAHAYEVAQKALKENPKSLFWRQKMGEISLWTNRSHEAMHHITYLYKQTHDPKLADSLIQQLVAMYQYKKALPIVKDAYHDKQTDEKNVVDIYDKVGIPEEAITLLQERYKQEPSPWLLTTILSLYLDIGELEQAGKTVALMHQNPDRSIMAASALAKYYFVKKDLKRVYKELLRVKDQASIHDVDYLIQLSDLAWYLQEHKNATYASMMLFKAKKERKIDYERLLTYFLPKDLSITKLVALRTLKEHKTDKFLIPHLQKSLEQKDYKALQQLYQTIASDRASLAIVEKNPLYWIVQSEVEKHFKNANASQKSLAQALALSPDSPQIQNIILWSLIDNFQYKALGSMVEKITTQKELPKSLYHALSAAYLTLQKPDKATYYLAPLLREDTTDMDLLFLKAEVLSLQGKEEEKKRQLRTIFDLLDQRAKSNPKLRQDKQFLRQYLQAYLELTSAHKFQKALKETKPYLSKKDYEELTIIAALKSRNLPQALDTYHDSKRYNPQFALELSHLLKDDAKVKKLIQHYNVGVPNHIKVVSRLKEDNIQKAIKETKMAIKANQHNVALKEQLHTLYKHYAHHTTLDAGYNKRGPLKVSSIQLENFYYLSRGFGLVGKIEALEFKSSHFARLPIEKERQLTYTLGVQKQFLDNTTMQATLSYDDSSKDNIGIEVDLSTQITPKFTVKTGIALSKRVKDQSTFMYVGGYKDSLVTEATYLMHPNHYLILEANMENFYANDGIRIGDGIRLHASYNYIFSHFPYTSMQLFYGYGDFSEGEHKGSIGSLLPRREQDAQLLQNDYSDAGIGFRYGHQRLLTAKRLQPFFDIVGAYSSKEDRFYTLLNAGIVGKGIGEDTFMFNTQYQNSINGLNNEEFDAHLQYTKRY